MRSSDPLTEHKQRECRETEEQSEAGKQHVVEMMDDEKWILYDDQVRVTSERSDTLGAVFKRMLTDRG
jgi:hypothetical protein